jgi:hypothetical protein
MLDVQRRYRELGRIRLGEKGAKGEPQKLDTFRLTSPNIHYLEVASLKYGGTVELWQDAPTGEQWQLVTDTNQLDVLVPPQRISDSQGYALWTAGGLQRRCDGSTQTDGTACVCDPTDRECKPVTHLQVMLPRLPDLGVWRLTTTGFNAAAELPMTVDLLSALTDAGRPIPAVLMIEHRTSKVGGQTRRYVVPTLGFVKSIAELEEVAELEPGTLQRILTAPVRAAAAARPVLPAERAALPAEPAPIPTPDDSVEPTGRVTADGSTDVPAAEPPTLAPQDPDGGSAADVRTTIMALQPSEAMVLARLLLTERPATPEAMPAHQLWVRRLFYAMEHCGLWRPAEVASVVVDPLHLALRDYHEADHLADLLRDDLLNFVAQAADAADAKLGEQDTL